MLLSAGLLLGKRQPGSHGMAKILCPPAPSTCQELLPFHVCVAKETGDLEGTVSVVLSLSLSLQAGLCDY